MYEIKTLDDVRGNNVAVYSIKTLLERKSFPKLSIMSGVMGVGKTSVARVVAETLDKSGMPIKVYNFGMSVDIPKVQEEVFSLNPAKPRAFIFEEFHGLPKNEQNALLQLFDSQSPNVYVVCTTTEIHKIIRTIRSRAHVWEFKLLSDKQLSQLLDDYLASRDVVLSQQSKVSLLKACHGVPRDLIKNADFAIAGEFDSLQLDALLGNVSDELLYGVFCALRSNTVDFVMNIDSLIEEVSNAKLNAMRDFWLRYLLERSGSTTKTLSPSAISTLDTLYDNKDIQAISKLLLRANHDSLLLELVTLNMQFNSSNATTVLGQQRDNSIISERAKQIERQQGQRVPDGAQLSAESVRSIRL